MGFQGFDLPEDLRILSDEVRRFVTEEIRPVEARLDAEARDLPPEELHRLQGRARAAGFWCFDAPAEFGGGGLSTFQSVVVLEQAVKHKFSFPVPGGGVFGYSPPVILFGSRRQHLDRYVIPSIREGWASFTAISESTGGSDPARAIRATATRTPDGYLLKGRKLWATNADHARYGVVYARTSQVGGRAGISAFVVDSGLPGMSVTPVPVIRDHWTTELVLDDVNVPADSLVGREGDGFALAQTWLVRARLAYAAQAVGVAQAALEMGIEWAKQRETFGALLASRQAVQFAIADSLVEVRAGRHLTWEAAWLDDTGKDARMAASVAKLYCTEVGFQVVDRMIQIFGAMGLTKELPLERWFRNLRVSRIVEGPSEVHRYVIAREVLGAAATGH